MTGIFRFPFKSPRPRYAVRTVFRVFRRLAPLLFICIWVLYGTGTSTAKSVEVKKKVGNYEVGVTIDRNPPTIGDNHIEIEITDGNAKPVTDAKVLVNYYMPPMPRMAPMNYTTEAKLKKDKYCATLNIIMAGPWYIAVKIHHGGKISTLKFNIDAR